MIPSNVTFVGFDNSHVSIQGYVDIPMSIKGIEKIHQFHILPLQSSVEAVILGKQWQQKNNAYLDWANDRVYFDLKGQCSYLPFTTNLDFKMMVQEDEQQNQLINNPAD